MSLGGGGGGGGGGCVHIRSMVNEAIRTNSFLYRKKGKILNGKEKAETQNKQFPPSYEVFVHEKLLLLLFSIYLFLLLVGYYLLCVFCTTKIFCKKN